MLTNHLLMLGLSVAAYFANLSSADEKYRAQFYTDEKCSDKIGREIDMTNDGVLTGPSQSFYPWRRTSWGYEKQEWDFSLYASPFTTSNETHPCYKYCTDIPLMEMGEVSLLGKVQTQGRCIWLDNPFSPKNGSSYWISTDTCDRNSKRNKYTKCS